MSAKKIFIFTTLFLLSLLATNVLSYEPVLKPHVFYGWVFLSNGDPVPAGLTLIAKINDTDYGSTTTSSGKYDYLIVTDPNSQNKGKTIYFYVSGIQATPTYAFDNGGFTQLNLTLTVPLPTTITTTTVGGGGGRGGGGGGSTTTSTTSTTTTVSPTAEEVEIDVVNIKIPSNVTADEPFEIEVLVKNVGGIKGSDDIELSLPEGWSSNKYGATITLKPDETKKLYFTITPNEDSGEISVDSSSDSETSDNIEPIVPKKAPLPITGMLLTALASIGYWWIPIIVIILALVYFVKRKPSKKKSYEYKRKKKR